MRACSHRYRILPVAGNEYLDDAAAASKSPDFLFNEVQQRIASEPVKLRILVQLAEDGDITDDATVRWPESRQFLMFGEISLTEVAPDNPAEQRWIIFDPVPRVDGIEASADPLFEPRANVYLMSGRRRRSAAKQISAADRSLLHFPGLGTSEAWGTPMMAIPPSLLRR
ncbi:MAG TPA: hypothetical protein VF772_14365 [Terriglobales bacterium]